MPVQRFRSFEDARRALWVDSRDPSLAARIRRVWRLSARLAAPTPRRGVIRFRSMEEANRERDARVTARVHALLAKRARAGLTQSPYGRRIQPPHHVPRPDQSHRIHPQRAFGHEEDHASLVENREALSTANRRVTAVAPR